MTQARTAPAAIALAAALCVAAAVPAGAEPGYGSSFARSLGKGNPPASGLGSAPGKPNRFNEPTGLPLGIDQPPVRYIAPSARVAFGYPSWNAYCRSKYRSYNALTGTYTGFDGKQHACR